MKTVKISTRADHRIEELEATVRQQASQLEATFEIGAQAIEKRVAAEVAALMAPLRRTGEGADLRFNKKELALIEGLLTAAKTASVGVGSLASVKELGAFFERGITALLAAKSPGAVLAMLPAAGAPPTRAEFQAAQMGKCEAAKKVAAYVRELHIADPSKSEGQHLAEAMGAARLRSGKAEV
jgi:hypothetical protein